MKSVATNVCNNKFVVIKFNIDTKFHIKFTLFSLVNDC